jgi:hypothetical protein
MKQICEYMAHNQICESFLLAIVTAVNCRVLQIGFAKKKTWHTTRNRTQTRQKIICDFIAGGHGGGHAKGAN